MFGTLRNKFQTVQEGLSASIRGLTVNESPKLKKLTRSRNVNYDAGADILHHFQMQWNELHELAEENAGKAQEAETLITSIYIRLEQEWNNVVSFNNILSTIPIINNTIQNIMDQIGTIQEMFEEVELSILDLENLNEMLDSQNHQIDHRLQLALYRENKNSELDSLKAKLAHDHEEKISRYEFQQQKTMRERHRTFEGVFQEELEEYKATGSIPKLPIMQDGPTLDEIILDDDPKTIDDFLNS